MSEVEKPSLDYEAFREIKRNLDLKEDIFLIESPSPEDLYHGRNEGDALAKTLSLAEINVTYYLVTSEELFTRALDDIVIRINGSARDRPEWPFIHISAHGSDEGLELTDGDCLMWPQLTRRLQQVHDLVGGLGISPPFPQNVPRINLSLSSCSAFKNYSNNLHGQPPFQVMIGPNVDVGWCQSLIGFCTFFYQSFILQCSFFDALEAMNSASGTDGDAIFSILDKYGLQKFAQDFAEEHFNIVKHVKGE